MKFHDMHNNNCVPSSSNLSNSFHQENQGKRCRQLQAEIDTSIYLFEPKTGLEPVTHALRMRCSTN